MSLVQQQRVERNQRDSAIENAVPGPPVELERIRRAPSRETQPATQSRQANTSLEPITSNRIPLNSQAIRTIRADDSTAAASVTSQVLLLSSARTQTGQTSETEARYRSRIARSHIEPIHSPVLEPIETQQAKGTYGIKSHGNILTRLFAIETTSLHKLAVTEVDEFENEEAELKYQKFSDFLRVASNDLSSPENDPLIHFRGRWIEHDQVLLQPSGPDATPLPCVRFIGAKDENEVRILHASLSKRKFRKEFYPPLHVCYLIQQLQPLASDSDEVAPLQTNPNTLCGTLAAIGTGRERKILTIGGVVESVGAYYALTTSHDCRADPSPSIVEDFFSKLDINDDSYDHDVSGPLVDTSRRGEVSDISPDDGDENDEDGAPHPPAKHPSLGTVQSRGVDWALLRLRDPQFALPNLIDEGKVAGLTEDGALSGEPIYIGEVASEPKASFVRVMAGATGTKTVRLLRKAANVRHPSGSWPRTWKAKLGPTSDSKLKHGDSGAWVVDTSSGTAYGHIMVATDEHAYIQPFVDIFKDVQAQNGIHLKLASPFGQLAELAKLHHLSGNQSLADQYARRALNPAVLSRSSEPPTTSAILGCIQLSHSLDIDLVASLLTRTGRHIGLHLPELWSEAREGGLGDPDRVLALLIDLSEVSDIALPHDIRKGKQKQALNVLQTTLPDGSELQEKQEKDSKAEDYSITEKPATDRELVSKMENLMNTPQQQAGNVGPSRIATSYKVLEDVIVKRAYGWMIRTFFSVEADVVMVGLQNSGKTQLLRVLSGDGFIDTIPTVGFNMKRVRRGGVTLKFWDLGAQPRFRSMWPRYCRRVSSIVFVVNLEDTALFPIAREELHWLMSQPDTQGIPLLVLGKFRKFDTLTDGITIDTLIDSMDLVAIGGRAVSCYGVSILEETNVEAVIGWLLKNVDS